MVLGPRSSFALRPLLFALGIATLAACGDAPVPRVVVSSPSAAETVLPFGAGSVTGRLLGSTVLRVRVRTGEKVFTFDATPGWHLAFEQPVAAGEVGQGRETLASHLLSAKLAVAIEAGLQDTVFVAEVANGDHVRRAAEEAKRGWTDTRLVAVIHVDPDGAFDLVVPFAEGEDQVKVSGQAIGRRGPVEESVSRVFTLRPGVVVDLPVAVAALRAALEVHALDAHAVAALLGPYGEAAADLLARVGDASRLPLRADIVEVLGRLGLTAALVEALEDPSTDVRRMSLRWLEPEVRTSSEVRDAMQRVLRKHPLDAEIYEAVKGMILEAGVGAMRVLLGDLLRAAVRQPGIDGRVRWDLANETALEGDLEVFTHDPDPAVRMLALACLVEGVATGEGRKTPWVLRLEEEVRLRETEGGGDDGSLELGRSTLRSLLDRAER